MALGNVDIKEPLVGSNIHVGLATVLRNEDLPVYVRIHSSSVIVQVRVYLDRSNPEPPHLHYLSNRSGDNPLADTGHYAASDKYEFRQRVTWRGLITYSKD